MSRSVQDVVGGGTFQELPIEDGDLVCGMAVIFQVMREDGREVIITRRSKGMSWITYRGMISVEAQDQPWDHTS